MTSLILSTHCSTFPCWGGYRKLTGDSIDPAIRVAGGALFGGPIGAAVAAVSVAINRFRGDSADLSSDPTTQMVQVDRPPIALSARLPQASTKQALLQDQAGIDLISTLKRPGQSLAATGVNSLSEYNDEIGRMIRSLFEQLDQDPVQESRHNMWMLLQSYGRDLAALTDEHSTKRAPKIDIVV